MKHDSLSYIPDDEELLIGAFIVTENFEIIKRRWKRQKELGVSQVEDEPLKSDLLGGQIFCLRVHGKQQQLLATAEVRTPIGLYYSQSRGALFTASDHWLMEIKNGQVINAHNNRLFNCLHGIAPSLRKEVEAIYIASTGIDAILEIAVDNPQQCLWQWVATDHGFRHTPIGQIRHVDSEAIHQGVEYATPSHTTHVNSVLQVDSHTILVVLFHQGQLIAIDIKSNEVKILLDGLEHPHGIRRGKKNQFMICDTSRGKLLVLNSNFQVHHEILIQSDWIQDAVELNDGSIVIADASGHRLVRKGEQDEWEWGFSQKNRVGSLLPLSAKKCKTIF